MSIKKTASFIFVSTFIVIAASLEVFGHCHNDDPCEKPFQHLIPGERWDELGSPEKVKYYIGTFPGPFSLVTDVQVAASYWSNVQFNGETVKFQLDYKGRKSRPVLNKDGWSMVDWEALPEGALGVTITWYNAANPQQIVECDTAFNYYEPYAPHQSQGFPTNKYCLRNVATHEFGHWVALLDVGQPPHIDPNDDPFCESYWRYTMYFDISSSDIGPGNEPHQREILECEDKYGLWYTYNEMTWSAPPLLVQPEIVNFSAEAMGIEKTRLLQNYPHPFNPETWIPYELSKKADVILEIHDSAGHLVRKLVLGTKPKGRYLDKRRAAYWDGRNETGALVPSGVYFYTLKAGEFSDTRKMILLK